MYGCPSRKFAPYLLANFTMSSKKKVSVSFVGEEDVFQPIIPINERKQSSSKKTCNLNGTTDAAKQMLDDDEDDDDEVVLLDESDELLKPSDSEGLREHRSVSSNAPALVEDEEENEEEPMDETEDLFKPSEALADEAALTGGDVYGFQRRHLKSAMIDTATESARAATPKSPSTPKSKRPRSAQGTPTSKTKSTLKNTPNKSLSSATPSTPTNAHLRKTRGCAKKVEASTPFRLRARNKEVVDSDSDASVSDSEEEEEEGSEEEEEENRKPGKTQTPGKSQPSAKPQTPSTGRKRRLMKDDVMVTQPADVESYFALHAADGVTSDHTLARLDTPRMDQEALRSVLSGVGAYYVEERTALYQEYRQCFNQWMFHLCNGFNLLFHGVGSKRHLLEDFRNAMLSDFTHVVVNGYFPSITIKAILNSITEDILEHSGSFRSPVDQCEFIRKHYECGDYSDFYLIIHNIDGAMLRPEKTQTVLSLLAQIRGFHIIASIDHINAPLIWDQSKSSRFNWLWFDTTTYDPYTEETSYENSLMVQQSGSLALSSMTHVMRSLTPNAKGIFILLVNYQLENKDNPMYQGLAFPDLYQKCREAFLVNSDQTLRTQLTEFKDHKLIRLKKTDGTDYLIIPLDDATLKEFLEQQES